MLLFIGMADLFARALEVGMIPGLYGLLILCDFESGPYFGIFVLGKEASIYESEL